MCVRTCLYAYAKQRERTALIRAAGAGRADCVSVLLENGSDNEAKDKVRPLDRHNIIRIHMDPRTRVHASRSRSMCM